MTTAGRREHQKPSAASQETTNMTSRSILLLCVVLLCSVDAEDKSRLYRRPSCSDMSVTEACPLNFSPVCGSNGVTYANECALCVHRLQTNADILIVKEGSC
ncbi:probable pancreatic secretory proteinase inhibitor [Myripristis murdjan]|uniref:probable pancreatic secretory proteinase inhibitor n=1 Tax=Myripristis murdjan TaxID=586833 RepID=UPI001175D97E|nr:probable pancreatic secretory proteinase inhibitor [Myripristis murdjan]